MLLSPIIAAFSVCQSVFPNACCRIRIERGKAIERLEHLDHLELAGQLYSLQNCRKPSRARRSLWSRFAAAIYQALVFGAIRANILLVNPSIVAPML
ncbi:MAG: hypothetical protein M3N35_09330 [Candidatus Binatota bacterium]|nr:hypothetical protein [Candidatus Binatota bacterium]